MRYVRTGSGEIVAEERDEVPPSKEDGWNRWRSEMELRFVSGEDGDFDYVEVDQNEKFDDRNVEEREQEDAWFEDEEPTWVKQDECHANVDGARVELRGQTGIQDF